jgi:hypothetical protein
LLLFVSVTLELLPNYLFSDILSIFFSPKAMLILLSRQNLKSAMNEGLMATLVS